MNEKSLTTRVLIGLEIHITVGSKKKIFNWGNTYKEKLIPNSEVEPWNLGYLGTLPIINPEVIHLGLKLSLALGMKISKSILFDRKIYNYFDLPKGYQITQHEIPFAVNGYLPIINKDKLEKIPIKILQFEEDAAKSIYYQEGVKLDFNRSGNPLIELVTEPVFHKSEQVFLFIKQLQSLLRYLEVSEAKMENGQLRIDLNFSLQLGDNYATPRYEIKNLNSLVNIEKALQWEIKKHQLLFFEGNPPPLSQTLGFDESQQITVSHREKTAYFYLPEVNIPPINLKTSEIHKLKKTLPKLPWIYWEEIIKIDILTADKIVNNPNLLKIFNFLEKKKVFELKESKKLATFYLNYLSPHFENYHFNTIIKKWRSYYQIFQFWQNKKLENKEIENIVRSLLETNYSFKFLINKYKKKTIDIDEKFLEQELEKLWSDELAKKTITEYQKVQNYLLGQVKKKYLGLSVSIIIKVIEKFLLSKKIIC